jgi:hypothetical protein
MSTAAEPITDADEDPVQASPRRAPRIAQADVFAAADQLLLQGDRPTIDRVRMKLGRGSPNTINDHLDTWWAKLGARLRDVPGQEFPQLPERVGEVLHELWAAALTGAHEALRTSLEERDSALACRQSTLDSREQQCAEREQAALARTEALEQGLALVKEQLTAANQRAERLEATLAHRDADSERVRLRFTELEATVVGLRTKVDGAEVAHRDERAQLDARHAITEARWLSELDRARQAAKTAARPPRALMSGSWSRCVKGRRLCRATERLCGANSEIRARILRRQRPCASTSRPKWGGRLSGDRRPNVARRHASARGRNGRAGTKLGLLRVSYPLTRLRITVGRWRKRADAAGVLTYGDRIVFLGQ